MSDIEILSANGTQANLDISQGGIQLAGFTVGITATVEDISSTDYRMVNLYLDVAISDATNAVADSAVTMDLGQITVLPGLASNFVKDDTFLIPYSAIATIPESSLDTAIFANVTVTPKDTGILTINVTSGALAANDTFSVVIAGVFNYIAL